MRTKQQIEELKDAHERAALRITELEKAVSAAKAQFDFLGSLQEDGVSPVAGLHSEWSAKMAKALG